jgi:hypothetical protein
MNKVIKLTHWPFIVSLITFFLLLFSSSETSANLTVKQNPNKPKIVFNRALKNKVGKGGFAYHGIRKKYQIEDNLLAAISSAPKTSPWFESEKEFYLSFLKNRSFDVLVVPFQTQLDGVDPIGRSLISYRLAIEIEKRTKMSVAPLPLVQFALGSHSRFYDDATVYALAKKIGVSHIVWGFAGTHEDEKGHVQSLDITVVCQTKESFGTPEGSRGKSWKKINCKSNQLPSLIFEEKLTDIITFVNLPEKRAIQKVDNRQAKQPSIPQSPETIFSVKSNDPIAKSYYYQFMGMLIPPRAEFHRQYMFIRSLMALNEADTTHPDYAILKARAYHHLYRRPAAIDALQEKESGRAKLFRNMINGSLPALESIDNMLAASTMDDFFATVEYSWLMYRYTTKVPKQHIDQLIDKYPAWEYFFDLIINDQSGWEVPTNIVLKQVLDTIYPVKGFMFEDLLNDLSAQDEPNEIDFKLNMVFQDHLRKSLPLVADNAFFETHNSGPNHFDYHIMLEGIGVSNLLKRLYFLDSVQCLPEESMKLCTNYLKHYQGHPYFTLMHAKIQKDGAHILQGDERRKAIDESVTDAILGLWWYGRQGWAFSKAHSVLSSRHTSKSELLDQIISHKSLLYVIASDYPFIPKCSRSGFMRPYEDLIDWSCWDTKDLRTVVNIYRKDKEMMALIQDKTKGRFLGHPMRHKFQIAMGSASQTIDDKKRPYLQMIDQGSENWKIYRKLGEMYVDEGKYKKAHEVFLRYPGFNGKATTNRVGLSNQAYTAGSFLFWKGAYHEAKPLYEYSANLNTGSAGCLTSRARVAILDRDLNTAADYMLRRAKRYDVSYAYRDYMSISHMLGDSQKAWDQFTALLGRYYDPHIWTSAFIGHRIQKTAKDGLKRWIKDMAALNKTSKQRSFPSRFAFMCLIDRPPDMKMAEFVGTVDDLGKYDFTKRRLFKGPDGKMIGPEMIGRLHYIDLFDTDTGLPRMWPDLKNAKHNYYNVDIPKEPFSFYGSLALAYERLKKQDYTESYEILKKQSYLYSYELGFGKPAKSYLVWAGMNSGKRKEAEYFLGHLLIQAGIKKVPGKRKLSDEHFEFDDELSIAAYQCVVGNHDQAVERIKKAFIKRPHTEKRPIFSWYQIVELCEWFYEYSDDRRFLELALKWSRNYQVIQPMFGWAFAFEAKYTNNEQDRLRALGYALHLDSQSWRIAHFSNAEKDAAREWFKENNQFQKKEEKSAPTKT